MRGVLAPMLGLLAPYLATPAVAQGAPWNELHVLPTNGREFEDFGYAVDLHDEIAVVGAPEWGTFLYRRGRAVLLRLDPPTGAWHQSAELFPIGSSTKDRFGESVAVHGLRAVVGAPGCDSGPFQFEDQGGVYTYELDPVSGVWTAQGLLLAHDGFEEDEFGFAVDVWGDRMIVGARLADAPHLQSGAAYLYHFDSVSQQWVLEAKLVPPDIHLFDGFGWSVALEGDVALIGCPNEDDLGISSGAAYVYRRRPGTTTWDQEAKLLASDGVAEDHFGTDVALSGPIAVIGAPDDDDAGFNVGSAYVFEYEPVTGAWTEGTELLPSRPSSFSVYGRTVAAFEDQVLVGDPTYTRAFFDSPGAAYLYRRERSSGTWQEEALVTNSTGVSLDGFGQSVAIDGNRLFIGSPWTRHVFREQGIAAFYTPFLGASAPTFSASLGARVDFELIFPVSESTASYALLASARGPRGLIVSGVEVPLAPDPLLRRMASGSPPPGFPVPFGTLNTEARAFASLHVGPGHAVSAIGRTLWFAALTWEWSGGVLTVREVSSNVELFVEP